MAMNDFIYVYAVPEGRPDGLVYAFQHTWHPGRVLAMFRDAIDAQRWIAEMERQGNRVQVMPSCGSALTSTP